MAALAPHAGQRARRRRHRCARGRQVDDHERARQRPIGRAGTRVGVLAVDPSSPFSGGALLGDRVRMPDHAADPEVFIRSMASRGHLGGLSWATPQALRVLDAAGLRRRAGRDRRGRPVARSRSRRRPTPPSCCWHPAWATASRRPRPASSRSATCSSSTRPTGTAPTRPCATCGTPSRWATGSSRGRGARPWCAPWPPRGRGSRTSSRRIEEHRAGLGDDGLRDAPGTPGRARGRGARPGGAARRGSAGSPATPASTSLAAEVVAGRTDPYAAADLLVRRLTAGGSTRAVARRPERPGFVGRARWTGASETPPTSPDLAEADPARELVTLRPFRAATSR